MKENIKEDLQKIITRNCELFNCSELKSIQMTSDFLSVIKSDYIKKGVDDLLIKTVSSFESELKNNYESK